MKLSLTTILVLFFSLLMLAQNNNTITTAVPFLEINPNTFSRAVGEVGVVSSADYYETGLTQNPALLCNNTGKVNVKFSYMPWLINKWLNYKWLPLGERLKNTFNDMSIYDFNMRYSIDSISAIGYSFNYFNIGEFYLDTLNGQLVHPREYYHNLRYSRIISKRLCVGIGLKYIKSDLDARIYYPGYKALHTAATDIGLQYRNCYKINEKSLLPWSIGLAVTNIGPRVSYNTGKLPDFIPTTLKLGLMGTYKYSIDENVIVGISLMYQADKLLVPTPPQYQQDSMGNRVKDINGNYLITKGKDPNVSAAKGMFQSFNDAPGGFTEELHEIMNHVGFEARLDFKKIFYVAFRAGRFIEHPTKGGRKFTTWGLGLGWNNGVSFDFASISAPDEPFLNKTWSLTVAYKFSRRTQAHNLHGTG